MRAQTAIQTGSRVTRGRINCLLKGFKKTMYFIDQIFTRFRFFTYCRRKQVCKAQIQSAPGIGTISGWGQDCASAEADDPRTVTTPLVMRERTRCVIRRRLLYKSVTSSQGMQPQLALPNIEGRPRGRHVPRSRTCQGVQCASSQHLSCNPYIWDST